MSGVILGVLYLRTRSLWSPFAAHLVKNALTLGILALTSASFYPGRSMQR